MVWEIISVNRGNWIYIFAVLATLLSWVERGGICLCSGWLQSPEESTALPLSLFCLLSVQCAGRPEQLRWYGDGVLASVPIWVVCLCAVQSAQRREAREADDEAAPKARSGPRPRAGLSWSPSHPPCLPRPHALGANCNLLRGSLPSQSYFTFAHPSPDIHLRKRGQY